MHRPDLTHLLGGLLGLAALGGLAVLLLVGPGPDRDGDAVALPTAAQEAAAPTPGPEDAPAGGAAAEPEREPPRATTPEAIEETWKAFLEAIGGDGPIPVSDSYLQAAMDLRERQRELARQRPELRDYPFLDPVDDAPMSDQREFKEFRQILDEEYWHLKEGMTVDDIIGPPMTSTTGAERRMEGASMMLDDSWFVATLPPAVLVDNPLYGEAVSEGIIRERLPLLQSLRLEYLHDIAPFLAERSQLRYWRGLTKGLGVPPGLPPRRPPRPRGHRRLGRAADAGTRSRDGRVPPPLPARPRRGHRGAAAAAGGLKPQPAAVRPPSHRSRGAPADHRRAGDAG